jgi:cytochrome c5
MRAALFLAACLTPGPAFASDAPVEGKRIFDRVCSACHANDLSDAPQLKQPPVWTARLAKGRDALHHNAINGFVGTTGYELPPRGGRPELTDAEVRAAVDYIISTVNITRTTP